MDLIPKLDLGAMLHSDPMLGLLAIPQQIYWNGRSLAPRMYVVFLVEGVVGMSSPPHPLLVTNFQPPLLMMFRSVVATVHERDQEVFPPPRPPLARITSSLTAPPKGSWASCNQGWLQLGRGQGENLAAPPKGGWERCNLRVGATRGGAAVCCLPSIRKAILKVRKWGCSSQPCGVGEAKPLGHNFLAWVPLGHGRGSAANTTPFQVRIHLSWFSLPSAFRSHVDGMAACHWRWQGRVPLAHLRFSFYTNYFLLEHSGS